MKGTDLDRPTRHPDKDDEEFYRRYFQWAELLRGMRDPEAADYVNEDDSGPGNWRGLPDDPRSMSFGDIEAILGEAEGVELPQGFGRD